MTETRLDRRRFLKGGTTIAGLTAGAVSSAVAQTGAPANTEALLEYGDRSRYVTSKRVPDEDEVHSHYHRMEGRLTPLQDSMGIITPSSLHFVTMHGYYPPDINPDEHRLMIHGMVDNPLVLSMNDILRMPSVSRVHFLECQANRPETRGKTVQLSAGKTSCAEWTGVLLSVLLNEVGVDPKAEWIVYEGAEPGKMIKSLPMVKAMADTIVAYGMNGEPIRPQNGYPLRMFVPGFEALYSIKWLRRIKVVDRPYMGYQEIRQYTSRPNRASDERTPFYNFEMGPKSVITAPSGEMRLVGKGIQRITGLAWSGGGAITRVEVLTDNGGTWYDAELQGPAHRIAHTRFNYNWNWNGEETVIMSRCTDELGQLQPSMAQFAAYWNTTPEKLLSGDGRGSGHHNSIQPWGIRADGSVYNVFA